MRLTSIEIPNSVTWIGVRAFYDCRSLKSIVIPNSVIRLSTGAFRDCYLLESITIPTSVEFRSVDRWIFSNCISLKSITYLGTKEEAIQVGIGNISYDLWREGSAISKIICTDGVIDVGTKSKHLSESLTDDIDRKLIHLVQSKLSGPLADRVGSSNFYSENGQRFMSIPVSTNSDSFDFESYKQDLKKYVFPNSDIYAMMDDYEIVIDVTDFYTNSVDNSDSNLSESAKHLDTDYQKKNILEDNTTLTEGRNAELDNLDNIVKQEDGTYLLMIDKGGIIFEDEASLEDFIQDCTTIGIFDTDGIKDFITRFNVKDGSLRKALKDYIAELNSYDDGGLNEDVRESLKESKRLTEGWKDFYYSDYDDEDVVTVVLTDKRFTPIFT
jgi:hypothetical protein